MSCLMVPLSFLALFGSPPGNQDMWISALLSFPIYLIFCIPAYLLSMRFRNRTIIQAAEDILGSAGKIIGVLYIWFFIHIATLNFRTMGDLLVSNPYPETPLLVFIISTALVAAYTVKNGIEVIGRFGEIVVPSVMLLILLVIALVVKDMDLLALLPILEKGFKTDLFGGFIIASKYIEIIFIPMLMPYINRPKLVKKSIILAGLWLTLYLVLIATSVVAVFGVEQAANRAYVFFSMVRIISIGGFIERLDAIYIGVWILGMFLKIVIFYYLAVLSTAQLLNLKDYRPLTLAMGTVIVSLSVLQAESVIEMAEFHSYEILMFYDTFYIFVLPLLLFLVSYIRKRGIRNQ